LRQSRFTALVFRAIVQQRGYRLILIAAVFQDKRDLFESLDRAALPR
jgi:hypothetical protein